MVGSLWSLSVSNPKHISNPLTQVYETDLNEPVSEGTEDQRPTRTLWWKIRAALGWLPRREATDKDLRQAVRAQEIDEVMRLLEAGVTPAAYPDSPWLCLAARRENRVMMDLFVIYGADVNQVDRETRGARGRTALHEAAKRGWGKGIRLLLEAGANPNLVDDIGQSPLFVAVRRGQEDAVRMLLEAGACLNGPTGEPLPLLHEATSPELVDMLVLAGADVDAPNEMGFTPLHQQAKVGRDDVLGRLLYHQANPNAEDRAGRTAAFWLGKGRASPSLAALLSAGLDLEKSDHEGNVAAHLWPLRSRDQEFLAEGYTRAPNAWVAKNQRGETPLYVLSRTDKDGLFQKLQADLSAHASSGSEPVSRLA